MHRSALTNSAQWTLGLVLLLTLVQVGGIRAATPDRGLSTLPKGPLSIGYLNAVRKGVGSVPQNIAALNYEAVDIIAVAFTELNADGSLNTTSGTAGSYGPLLIPQAHARSCSVLMSVVGAFETVTASPALRLASATAIANALVAGGYDGVDFDWEWPSSAAERDQFTAFLKAVHTAVKSISTDYIVMFVQGPGYWLAATDWSAVRSYSDLCFLIAYDWKNPANGPIRNPGEIQYLGLDGGTIEASAKGAIDYVLAAGYPASKLVIGFPFYSSDNRSWFSGSSTWVTNRLDWLARRDANTLEILMDGAWWTPPDTLKQKLDSVLDPRRTVIAGGAVARGIGFWELGHEDLANPELSNSIRSWRAGDRSLGGLPLSDPAAPPPLIPVGSVWKYSDGGALPASNWADRNFSDAGWRQGRAPLGYGDAEVASIVKPPRIGAPALAAFFRQSFRITNTASLRSLTLRARLDDGAILFLNGMEVLRLNLPNTTPLTPISPALTETPQTALNRPFTVFALDPRMLVNGNNTLGLQLHPSSAEDKDVSFDLELAADEQPAQTMLISETALWRYQDDGKNPGTNWTLSGFDETRWPRGRGRLGYGLDGEKTTLLFGTRPAVKPITCYFRHAFVVNHSEITESLTLHIRADDGAAVYLNGTELVRLNLPQATLTGSTPALVPVHTPQETLWTRVTVSASALKPGLNLLAAEVHQSAANSEDLGWELIATATLRPRLEISATLPRLTLRWSAGAPGFQLQTASPHQSPTAWFRTTDPITLRDGTNSLSFEPKDSSAWFRLATP